ncbi:hypothetical protein A8C56_16005 [Niabella ginsenosidivorans]|uniref:Uncharacterized protein n=1 Tax=Niabella ginsenosidivorans TaxID=1176587 RepID=A0A1A9I9G9_9BACT|nr:hypothetical protein A8C56_16005 [Niabella ginsenosidivorans]
MTAKQYSDEVLRMQQSLAEPIRQAENEIKAFGDSANYSGMAGAAGKMESLIQGKIDTLNKIDAASFQGGADFKTVVIRYFEYLKSVYSSYKEIGNAANGVERLKATDDMYQKLSAQQDVEERMRTSQTRFAALNGFMFTEPDLAQPDSSSNR